MKWLTKSDYLKYLIHPAYLWLQKHDKDRLPPFDDAVKAIIAAGNEVEECARRLPVFNDAVMVTSLFQDSVRDTEKFVKQDADCIFQAAVLTDRRLYAKTDALKNNHDGSFDIYEIKSSTKQKNEHIHDIAFQRLAFEESGYIIKRTYLMHINGEYVRSGPIDPSQLFVVNDVTAEVEAILLQTKQRINKALAVIALPQCPDDSPAGSSNWYAWRDAYRYMHTDIPATSILNLTRLSPDQVRAFAAAGVSDMFEITDDFELKPQQIAQLQALKSNSPIIKPHEITKHMRALQFPLYFFDYETVGPGIPLFDGTKPYQQVPFQYSLHVLRSQHGELEHYEFLHISKANPMPALLTQMRHDIGDEGSVIVWYKAFEGGVNAMMAEIYPECADFLNSVNDRMYDQMEIFSKFYYLDAKFDGSSSIKKVLPVLVPELSYSNLEIQKGDAAQRLWEQAVKGSMSSDAAEKVFTDLRVYCGQDTLAMVKIYEAINKILETTPGTQLSLL